VAKRWWIGAEEGSGDKGVFIDGHFFVSACICDMMAALTVTHFCCDIIQHDGFGEGTGFLLLALTLSGAFLVRCNV